MVAHQTSAPAALMRRVCVTGASGYVASWLVKRLLERGYSVRGTVRSLGPTKTAHLVALPGAHERLELVEADLMDQPSLLAAVQGCQGVFAVAAPLDPSSADNEVGLIKLIQETNMNVLKACYESGSVKKIVITSSYLAAIQVPNNSHMPLIVDESIWTSVEYCVENKMIFWGYMVGKSLAEKEAFEYGERYGIDVVSILPSFVGGPFLTTHIPTSVSLYLGAITDISEWMKPLLAYMSYVHIDDCAQAHILLMEDSHAKGRYLCSAFDASIEEVLQEVSPLLKAFNLPKPKFKNDADYHENMCKVPYKVHTKKLQDLGFSYEYANIREIFRDAMLCLLEKGYLGREC